MVSIKIISAGERDRDPDRDRDRDTVFRFRERQYSGSRRWLETALRDNGVSLGGEKDNLSENKKKDSPLPSPIWLGEDLEFWPEKGLGSPPRFSHIAALHSELVAVGINGQLYQWKWNESEPYIHSGVCKLFVCVNLFHLMKCNSLRQFITGKFYWYLEP